MRLTDEQKTALQTQIEARAAQYVTEPSKGLAAGYQPEQVRTWGPSEVGRPRERMNRRSDYESWLYGVARKDLPPGTWRIQAVVGEGPSSAFLIVL